MKKLVRSLFILLMVLATTIAWSADLEMVLAPPLKPAQGGDVVVLDLYLHNHTDVTITRDLPPTLTCRIDTDRSTVSVNADLVGREGESNVEIPGRGFSKRQYTVTLPVYATGSVRIMLEALDTNPLIIPVEKAPPEAWGDQQVPLDEGPTMIQSFLDDLSAYEPMYFLLGVDPGLDLS